MQYVDIPGVYMRLYTREEAAKVLNVSLKTISNYIRSGRLPAQTVRGRYVITEKNLIAFLSGAKSTRSRNKVEPPKFENQEFDDAPPDPWESDDN